MAEGDDSERSQDPTQKRLDEAIRRGDVVKSQELSTWFVIAGANIVLVTFSGSMSSGLSTTMRGLLANSYQIPMDGRGLIALLHRLGFEVLAAVTIPLLLLALAALAGNMVQHRFVWSTEQLKPQLRKISPAAGFGRLFSRQSFMNFVKGLAKIALLGTIMTLILWPQRDVLESLVFTDPAAVLPLAEKLSVKVLGVVVAVLALIAAGDYLFQYRQWYERQKMSFSELKEEFRQTEGDPIVKGKIRQMRQARARKRMMANVPKAAVVITNPTHFAVALQYERGMNAPICVAKGADLIAKRIREVAAQHDIPVVENPPLARALHSTIEIDQEVPPEHYKAVAEVIGYVMRLKRALRH